MAQIVESVAERSASTAPQLASQIEEFLTASPKSVVLEDGRILFDMQVARYSLSSEQGRCMLHLWSGDRNLVRTVTAVRIRKNSLRLEVRRFGQSKPQAMELVADRDRRPPGTRQTTRTKYLRMLERVSTAYFPGYTLDGLTTAADLEHSFGPAYARGTLRKGNAAWAVIGINEQESPAIIDGILTIGILWLAHCRATGSGNRHVEGLKIIVPAGTGQNTQSRMRWLRTSVAQWELFELDERSERLMPLDWQDSGNLHVELVHAFQPEATLERMAAAVDSVLNMLSPGLRRVTELRPRGPNEIALLLHGLEYARIRHGYAAGSFSRQDQVTFGAGANETGLTSATEDLFRELTQKLFEHRHAGGSMRDPLYRLQPERWLESALRSEISEIEPALRTEFLYSQVPAFSAGDRAMLDLLTVNQSGRLVVMELKADDDLHLPVQALDYWARVRQLQREGAFQPHGYFPGTELSPLPPILYLVAPALRIHPSTDTVLRHLSPEIPWELIGLNEGWRRDRKVILRKRSAG
ncbi:hypothetical protein [Silvibacterium acidisoli]|uniref:hypothetical protein n=1 Tax=Acidobacteriaceae bacterium ZG23-2 TaxID=2883246 RepID=UPI00406C43E7